MDDLVFDLEPKTVEVTIGSEKYDVREASEDAVVKYRNASLRALKVADGKIVGFNNTAEVEPLLVSLCLFKKDGSAVPQDDIRGWPARIVKKLFNLTKEMSDLDEKPETLEELTAKINELQKRRHELLTKGEDAKKLLPNASTDTFDTPAE